jgi:aminotransferase
MNQLLNKLDQQGIRKFFKMASEYDDVLSLTIGEPDFPTPYHIREEAINSLQQGKTWYSPIEGLVTLKQEISSY